MIDFDGYRPNVGIIISNRQGQVLWAKRCGQNSWQFPQGGINNGETPEQAMYRELYEEVGLSRQDVKILAVSKGWLRYKLPKRLVRNDSNPVCIGQKQRWFLLTLVSGEESINMQATKSPEFDGWRWVSYWYPVRQVISFKREVYRKVMKEFSSVVMAQPERASAVSKPNQYKSYSGANVSENKETAVAHNETERSSNGAKKDPRHQYKSHHKFKSNHNKRAVRQKGEQRG